MSVQTSLNQYFKITYKSTSNIKTKTQDAPLKENNVSKKQYRSTKVTKQSVRKRKKKSSSMIDPLSYCNILYEDKCSINESTNITQNVDDICISDDDDKKMNTQSDCCIVYESKLNDNTSTDKESTMECEQHVIERVCAKSQPKNHKREVSPCYKDKDVIKTPKTKCKSSTKSNNQRYSIEKDSELVDTQCEAMTNERNDLSSQSQYDTSVKNLQDSPSKQKTTFSPKKSSEKKVDLGSKSLNLFYRTIVNRELMTTAIENLNLVKQGAIRANNFDLEEIYNSSNSFTFKCNSIDTTASTKYEYDDVIVPLETYAARLFMIVVNVFSNPINCGYFDEDETDFIFSMLTLSVEAQILLAHLLKRKHSWHTVNDLNHKYKIANDLIPICKELVSKSFLTSDIKNEDLSTLLKMLQLNEVRKICQELKIKVNNNKETLVENLLKVAAEKPLFPGMRSPGAQLKTLTSNKLGHCINLTQKTIDIFKKILTLLIPNQDPQKTLSDTYHMLMEIELEKMSFPKFSNKRYPIFRNEKQLIEYIAAKQELTNILNAIEKKKWVTVREIGKLAYEQWLIINDSESASLKDSVLPLHIRHYMPGYLWLKVLSESISAFKKEKEMLPYAKTILYTLIRQNCHMQSRKGMWYAELALIEIHHNKNLEASANIILESLKNETLSEVGVAEMLERAKKIVKRKKLNSTTLVSIQNVLKTMENRFTSLSPPNIITIEAALVKENYGMVSKKSMWYINNSTSSTSYSSVENVALNHYYCQSFKGLHCEGSLPVTLFFALFWNELYDINVPGSFVTLYQKAPGDLFTQDFYKNRKEMIDKRLQMARNFDSETFSNFMQNQFVTHSDVESMMHTKLFTSNDIRDIVCCLGTEGVIGICEQLVHNFTLWSAGFPDLIVWNSSSKYCKIVEVKGPGDKLSIKQTLWLKYLHQLGLNVEVCLVKDNGHGKIQRS